MYPRLTREPGAIATAAAITRGELSPLEAVDAAIGRIEALDGPINAVVIRDFDRARATAKAMTSTTPGPDQPLFGLPMTIKESFDIAGLPTSWGIEQHRGNIAARDAVVVQRLKRAGAVFLGKTNVPPFLADWQADNPIHGRTNNPHDLALSPGGSVRIPAHFCGVWGHKPTWGVVTLEGQDPPGTGGHELALGVVGPLARTGEDLALLLELTLDRPLARRDRALGDCRFLYLDRHPLVDVDDSVREPVEAAVAAIGAAGAAISHDTSGLPDLVAAPHRDYLRMLNIAMAGGAPGPGSQVATAADWFALLEAQAEVQRAWRGVFETVDFLLFPPCAVAAFPHDQSPMPGRTLLVNGQPMPVDAILAYAGMVTFPGLPSTVLPVGAAGHLPVGMQVIGPRFADRDCIAAATAIAKLLHG